MAMVVVVVAVVGGGACVWGEARATGRTEENDGSFKTKSVVHSNMK